jgi:hypothetical protein
MAELITDDEAQYLILRYLARKPQGTATESELQTFLDWAQDVRMNSCLLSLMLDGKIEVVGAESPSEYKWVRA